MVRAPCCEMTGLKKGPWTQEEDAMLVSYIQRYGHGNWRALPKLAGLLRCGKSCRLRWTNYLRPDIKRGNYSKEEEDMIISLHEMLGNRWSAIAARLPGRTDNEIKNVWHTHLKKRLKPTQSTDEPCKKRKAKPKPIMSESNPMVMQTESTAVPSSSENSSIVSPNCWSHSDGSWSRTDSSSFVIENTNDLSNYANESPMDFTSQELLEIDESFWNEALSMESCVAMPLTDAIAVEGDMHSSSSIREQLSLESLSNDEDVNFWLRTFMEAQELPEL